MHDYKLICKTELGNGEDGIATEETSALEIKGVGVLVKVTNTMDGVPVFSTTTFIHNVHIEEITEGEGENEKVTGYELAKNA